MGEHIEPFPQKTISSVMDLFSWFHTIKKLWQSVKAFVLLHYWKIILFIGVFVLLLETIEHLPAVINKTPFYVGEVVLVGLLLLVTGFLIRVLVQTVAERTEALNTLRVKNTISQHLAAGYDMKDVSEQLVREVTALVPGAGVELYLYGSRDNQLYRAAVANIEQLVDITARLVPGSDPCRSCFLEKFPDGSSVSICDPLNCPVSTTERRDFCLQLSHGSWLLGVLHLVIPEGNVLPARQITLLENIASDISSALGMVVRKIERDEISLTQRVNSVQMEIARDLHDTIGQNISYLRMKLEYLADSRPGADISPEILHMSTVANESYDLVRGTLAMLQPNRSAHLHELFEGHARQVMDRTGLEIIIDCHGEPRQITTRQMRQLFYVFREALNNIEKHARARRVRVETNWLNQEMTLTVSDDGQGFDPSQAIGANHYGLRFMRDRIEQLNGCFEVWSKPGEGSRLFVSFPYEIEMPFLPATERVN